MRRRHVTDAELNEALLNIIETSSTPEDSTCIVGKTKAGRVLKIWIVGTTFPPSTGVWILKSIAGKGEADG
jgi:hypothetical protein